MSKLNKSLVLAGLLLVVCIVSTGISSPFLDQGNYGSDEYEIKKTINSYFYWRYEGLKSNTAFLDLPSFIDNKNVSTREWFNKESDKRDVEIYIHKTYGVKILA